MNYPRAALANVTRPTAVMAAAITATMALVSCSPTGNPQLDMCMKIADNLLPGDVTFGEVAEEKGRTELHMTLPYSSNGVDSEAICIFAKQDLEKDSTNESYQSSPKTVILDDIEIASKDLMRASLASSKVVLKETAQETNKQVAKAADEAKVMATEAKDKATEMAADAKVKASELADEAKIKADEMATKIKESEVVDRAKVLADDATDKAKAAIVDGAKKIQESLENK